MNFLNHVYIDINKLNYAWGSYRRNIFHIVWAGLQYVRIILLIKHQEDAKKNTKSIDPKLFHADSMQNTEDDFFDSLSNTPYNRYNKKFNNEKKNKKNSGEDNGNKLDFNI